jgi:hypothetical protein
MTRFVSQQITLVTDEGPRLVEAQVLGGRLAVHRLLGSRGWCLTHAPTGVGLGVYARTERRIKDMARRVMAHPVLGEVFTHPTREGVEAAGTKAGITPNTIRQVAHNGC